MATSGSPGRKVIAGHRHRSPSSPSRRRRDGQWRSGHCTRDLGSRPATFSGYPAWNSRVARTSIVADRRAQCGKCRHPRGHADHRQFHMIYNPRVNSIREIAISSPCPITVMFVGLDQAIDIDRDRGARPRRGSSRRSGFPTPTTDRQHLIYGRIQTLTTMTSQQASTSLHFANKQVAAMAAQMEARRKAATGSAAPAVIPRKRGATWDRGNMRITAASPHHGPGQPRRRFRGIGAPTWDRGDLNMHTHRSSAATAMVPDNLGGDSAESWAPVRCTGLFFSQSRKSIQGRSIDAGHWAVSGRVLRTPCRSRAAGHRPACGLPRSVPLGRRDKCVAPTRPAPLGSRDQLLDESSVLAEAYLR